MNTEALTLEPDDFRSLERARLCALVERNMQLALQLHAPDFQLITPRGLAYSREQYLRDVESGELSYMEWEAKEIHVRPFPGIALLRYQAELKMGSPAQVSSFHCWHTDSYELRNGAWQVVWSQATVIR
jgi:hypothetical protein